MIYAIVGALILMLGAAATIYVVARGAASETARADGAEQELGVSRAQDKALRKWLAKNREIDRQVSADRRRSHSDRLRTAFNWLRKDDRKDDDAPPTDMG